MLLLNKKFLLFNTTCFLLVLFVQCFIALETATLTVANLKNFVVSSMFWLENNMIRKNLSSFAMLTQKRFLLFTVVA